MIKGNAAEIGALAKSDEVGKLYMYIAFTVIMTDYRHDHKQVKSKGVDAVGGGFANPGPMLKQLARAERTLKNLPKLYLILM